MHNSLASLFTKKWSESALVMGVKVILNKRLTTKLVHTLSNLVASSKSKTREKGSILLQESFIGSILSQYISVNFDLIIYHYPCIVPEIYLTLKTILFKAAWLSAKVLPPPKTYHAMWVTCCSWYHTTYSSLVTHKTLGNCINRVENQEFQDTWAGTTKEASSSWFWLSSGDGRRHDK